MADHDQGDSAPGELTSAQLDRQLRRRINRERPLDSDETAALRDLAEQFTPETMRLVAKMAKDYEYRQNKRAEFKEKWPMLMTVLTVLLGAATFTMNYLLSSKGHP